ncbi:tRNA (adenosine(37)-N6)-threonylcarbamoyltransferase complex dimerization subunit type 1 TsaB [bacterium]|nr:tRNA (adenosine(37)-N6)-threonylcarbamoyltransferase complex dimerization subunit type 1 TsaB [bacterium]
MKILAFDTCLDKMYVTLTEDKKILSSKIVTNKDNKYHSAFLISTIKEVLKENNLTPNDIEAIGTNIGPGSFTGIRACTTVARTIAQQLNIPAAGITSLEILAKLASDNEQYAVALDARKNCAYFYINNEIKGAIQLEEVEQILNSGKYALITDDKLQPRLGGVSYQQKEYPLGDILAELAYEKLKSEECKWQELKPLYIQPPPMG